MIAYLVRLPCWCRKTKPLPEASHKQVGYMGARRGWQGSLDFHWILKFVTVEFAYSCSSPNNDAVSSVPAESLSFTCIRIWLRLQLHCHFVYNDAFSSVSAEYFVP